MKHFFKCCALIFLLFCVPLVGSAEDTEPVPPLPSPDFPPPMNPQDSGVMEKKPVVEDLGKGMYRIGKILLDKHQGRFTVPGVVLPYEDGKPLEYIAVTKQGFKAYESLLELDANAFEFNLACILIGLDEKHGKPAKFHFDPDPMTGDQVSIRIRWQKDGKQLEVDPMEWLKLDEQHKAPAAWNYSGSQFIEGNRYLAQVDGTLIGLVHDPSTIIEHHTGVGLGNWGLLTVDSKQMPVGGTQVYLIVQRMSRATD